MKTQRSRFGLLAATGVALALVAPGLQAQTTTMPSTLRYGSGFMDTPVASVLPHLAIKGTYSGFFVDIDQSLATDEFGRTTGWGPGVDEYFQDGSVTLGLFDRAEVGATFQSFNDDDAGGDMWGLFGRLALIKPENQGIGLAVGARYVTAPTFAGSGQDDYQPPRLGFPDRRFQEDIGLAGAGDETNSTELSLYGVATAHLRGYDPGWLPQHDITVNAGFGSGMFSDGDEFDFYRFADSDGWFFGSGIHFGLGENAVWSFLGEYNGFDINLGTQLDFSGFRVGAHVLGTNYGDPLDDAPPGYYSEYRYPKFGVLASVALCPSQGGLCKPSLMERPQPDTVRLPAPPADTIRITREVERALPDGTLSSICLATGESVDIRVTAQGDTLVGPMRQNIDDLRPGVVFAGDYAADETWFIEDEPITFEQRRYDKSGNEVRLDCPDLMRVGEYMGVPLFAMRNADRPFDMLYVPVTPGVWQPYEYGLQRTRGQ